MIFSFGMVYYVKKEGMIFLVCTERKKDRICLLFLYLMYIVVLFLASSFTSPLYPNYYGDDSALFSLLGKGILQGKTLYTDLFDHKGPFIFFINAFGHFIGGYNGIFFLQCIFGCISLTFLYLTAQLLGANKKTVRECLLLFVCVYAVYFYTFERGNLTEEYSQPFISASLYFLIKYAVHTDIRTCHPPRYGFVYGVSLGFLAFLRVNNAVTVCAGIIAVFIFLIYKKEYKNLFLNLIAGLCGIAVIAIPVCLYFLYHSALYEMIYATFLYNFNIIGDSGRQLFLDHGFKFTVLYSPLVICGILIILHKKHSTTFLDCLLGTILAFNFLIFSLANRFPHYFAIFVPVYLVFLFQYFNINIGAKWKQRLSAILILACTVVNILHIGYYSAISVYSCYISQNAESRYASIQEAISVIPESERSSIIGYQIPVSYYVSGDILPCYKYYTWQEDWAKIDNQILLGFFDWMQSTPPLWVLTSPEEDNADLIQILQQQYEVIFENELLICYRLQ